MSNDNDWKAGLSRMLDAHMQVQKKSGPIYDKYLENTRIYGAAWRAAGRPRQVSQLHHAGQTQEITYFFTASLRNRKKGQDIEPATKDDWLRWENWKRERDRLREKIKAQK
jgi:hypothetical protein